MISYQKFEKMRFKVEVVPLPTELFVGIKVSQTIIYKNHFNQ
jgi:hypothetical protein